MRYYGALSMDHDQRQELVDAEAADATTTVATGTANAGVNAATSLVETGMADIALAARRLRFAYATALACSSRRHAVYGPRL